MPLRILPCDRALRADLAGDAGRIFPVSALDNRRKATKDELQLEERWYPIQVKQKDKVGRPDIDSFEAMMAREECAKGFFVSFDYADSALTEITRFFTQTGRVIGLPPVFDPLAMRVFVGFRGLGWG